MSDREPESRQPVPENASEAAPPPPAGLGLGGTAIWQDVLADYELGPHELRLLHDLACTVDIVDALQSSINTDGVMIRSVTDSAVLKTNPAVVEIRQARLVLARLAAALRLPIDEDDEDAPKRGQRRGAPRGVYTPQAQRS